MWLSLKAVCGLLVWLLLAETVAMLPSHSINKEWYLEESTLAKEVHPKAKHSPKEQLFLHRPVKSRFKGPRDFRLAKLLRGPSKASIKVPRTEALVKQQRSNLKNFGKVTHHAHRGPIKVNGSSAPPRGISLPGLRAKRKRLSSLLSTEQQHRLLTQYLLKGYGSDNEADMIGHEPLPEAAHLMALHSKSLDFDVRIRSILAPMLFVAVMLALMLVFCLAESDDARVDESPSGDIPKLYPPNALDDTAELGLQKANTKANLLKLENSPGTWARTYRLGDSGGREALELLFRCNIIPVHEFADSFVSQEHIDECVWISTQMLREKTLDEWIEVWPLGMKTFEESVTACFAARTDVISNLYGQSPPNTPPSPRSATGFMDCRKATSRPHDCQSFASTNEEQGECSATVLRNVLAKHAAARSYGPGPVFEVDRQELSTSRRVAVRPPRSMVSQANSRSSVVTRCREIMSTIQTRANRKDQDDSDSSADPPLVRRKSENASTSPPGSRSSTPPSMHIRDLPLPSIPASVSTLGRLDSYPPSEKVLQSSPIAIVTAPVDGSAASAGPTSSYAARTAGAEKTTSMSPTSPLSFVGLTGTTPHTEGSDIPTSWRNESSTRLGGIPGAVPSPKESMASPRGLSGTTPQPKQLCPKQLPTTPEVSPRDARGQRTPLFGIRQTLARASSSEDPFASLKHDQTRFLRR